MCHKDREDWSWIHAVSTVYRTGFEGFNIHVYLPISRYVTTENIIRVLYSGPERVDDVDAFNVQPPKVEFKNCRRSSRLASRSWSPLSLWTLSLICLSISKMTTRIELIGNLTFFPVRTLRLSSTSLSFRFSLSRRFFLLFSSSSRSRCFLFDLCRLPSLLREREPDRDLRRLCFDFERCFDSADEEESIDDDLDRPRCLRSWECYDSRYINLDESESYFRSQRAHTYNGIRADVSFPFAFFSTSFAGTMSTRVLLWRI